MICTRADDLWALLNGPDGWPVDSRLSWIPKFQYAETSFDLGKEFSFNNWMYMVAGEVAAKTAGQSWEDLVQSRIFNPLGMERS